MTIVIVLSIAAAVTGIVNNMLGILERFGLVSPGTKKKLSVPLASNPLQYPAHDLHFVMATN